MVITSVYKKIHFTKWKLFISRLLIKIRVILNMELTKNISQAKIIKSLIAIILGSIALTISAKI